MLGGFVGGLLVAWILSWFGVDHMMITAIQPFIKGVTLTWAHYYLAFAVVGLVGELLRRIFTVNIVKSEKEE